LSRRKTRFSSNAPKSSSGALDEKRDDAKGLKNPAEGGGESATRKRCGACPVFPHRAARRVYPNELILCHQNYPYKKDML
jgi:hypothetical protein